MSKKIRIALYVVILIIFAGYIISGILWHTPSVFGYRLFFIMSESMEPTIHTHQFVVGKTLSDEADIEIGDIVAYEKGEGMIKRTIIHRMIDRTEEGLYLLKGDNNSRSDYPVQRYRIKYRIAMPESAENIEIYGVP